jgi:hypothetical protein
LLQGALADASEFKVSVIIAKINDVVFDPAMQTFG